MTRTTGKETPRDLLGAAFSEADPGDPACPGLFYATHSGDGVLSRIRTPGGLVTSEQCALVADIADQFAGGLVTITNRANFQLRALSDRLPDGILAELQEIGLAGAAPTVDHLRNIMASPTAGLDPGAVVDTRPLVRALDRHIATNPRLAALPAKFSVGFDGGERASIAQLPNDVLFRAYRNGLGDVRFRVVVRVGANDGVCVDPGFSLRLHEVTPMAAAIAEEYLRLLPADGSRPRLRRLLATYERVLVQLVLLRHNRRLVISGPALPDPSQSHAPIGVHVQTASDSGDDAALTYLGVAPTIAGRITTTQLRVLADVATRYGSGSLRLSPWRNALIPDLPRDAVEAVQDELEAAGWSCRAASLASGIVACAGSAGCASGNVDTVRDAQALSALLATSPSTSAPLNIHVSGCAKCCAQRRPADITLLGQPGDGVRYAIFVRGDGDARMGRLLLDALSPDDALAAVARLVDKSGD